MATQDPPTIVTQASSQTSSVYETTKQHFLGLAKMLEKERSPPVSVKDPNAVITLMPSGMGANVQQVRILIENVLKGLHTHLNQQRQQARNLIENALEDQQSTQSDWKLERVVSADKSEFMIVLYRPDISSLQDVLQERSEIRQLSYTKAELKDN